MTIWIKYFYIFIIWYVIYDVNYTKDLSSKYI